MDSRIKPCCVVLEPCTPKAQKGLSAELHNVIKEKNILTTRTRMKVLSELDAINDTNLEIEQKQKRSEAIREIITSETSYLKQLELLKEYFMIPIKERNILSSNDYETLFGSLDVIYRVNNELFRELQENPDDISNAFSKLAPYFKLYSVYAYDYRKSLNVLQVSEIAILFYRFASTLYCFRWYSKKISSFLHFWIAKKVDQRFKPRCLHYL